MNDSSRTQGGLICVAVFVLAVWFVTGLIQQSYWAIALPVTVIVFFVLGLSFWVGYTIATIRVEPFDDGEAASAEPDPEPAAASPPSPTASPATPAASSQAAPARPESAPTGGDHARTPPSA